MEVIGLVGKNYGSSGNSGGGSIDQSVINQIDNNTNAITKLAQEGASLTLTSTSGTTVFAGTSITATLTAIFSSDILTPSLLKIVDSNSQILVSKSNSKSVSKEIQIENITEKKTYKAIAEIGTWKLEKSININVYNAIYYGMMSGDFDFSKLTKFTTPKSSAKSLQFTATAPENKSKFYILVPNGVIEPTSFTSEKVPVYFEKETYTNNEITYNKYKVGGEYDKGTTLTIDT